MRYKRLENFKLYSLYLSISGRYVEKEVPDNDSADMIVRVCHRFQCNSQKRKSDFYQLLL